MHAVSLWSSFGLLALATLFQLSSQRRLNWIWMMFSPLLWHIYYRLLVVEFTHFRLCKTLKMIYRYTHTHTPKQRKLTSIWLLFFFENTRNLNSYLHEKRLFSNSISPLFSCTTKLCMLSIRGPESILKPNLSLSLETASPDGHAQLRNIASVSRKLREINCERRTEIGQHPIFTGPSRLAEQVKQLDFFSGNLISRLYVQKCKGSSYVRVRVLPTMLGQGFLLNWLWFSFFFLSSFPSKNKENRHHKWGNEQTR